LVDNVRCQQYTETEGEEIFFHRLFLYFVTESGGVLLESALSMGRKTVLGVLCVMNVPDWVFDPSRLLAVMLYR
jgi:hypothetical protein